MQPASPERRRRRRQDLKVFPCRRVRVGDLLDGPAAILLAGEQPGDRPVGVRDQTPQTSALPAHRVLPGVPLLVLRAALPTAVLLPRLLPQVDGDATPPPPFVTAVEFSWKRAITGCVCLEAKFTGWSPSRKQG